jgi:hypothetical protein
MIFSIKDVRMWGSSRRALLNNPMLTLVLAGLYPALFLASNNWSLFTKIQLATLLLFCPLFILTLGIICYATIHIMQKAYFAIIHKINYEILSTKFQDNFFALFSCLIVLFLLQKTITTMIPNKAILIFTLSAITAGVVFAANWKSIKSLNIFLLILVTITAIQWARSYYASIPVIREALYYSKDKNFYDSLQFRQKPNVYLVVLESYHNNETLKNIYDIDNTEIEKLLSQNGFEIYDKTFSNYWDTTTSILSMFTMAHHYYKVSKGRHDALGARNIIGGVTYNPVLSVFKNNGYKIQYVHESDYCFFAGDPIDYASPKRTPFKVFEIYQIDVLDDFFGYFDDTYKGKAGKEKNQDRVYIDDHINIVKKRISVASEDPIPYFTFIKLGLSDHFPLYWDRIGASAQEVKKYLEDLKSVNLLISKFVKYLVPKDPDSIIILIGDHGAWKYGRVWLGDKSIHKMMEERSVQEAMVAQDLFGTFLAIKRSKNSEMSTHIISHVNLFRYIFSILCENDSVLENKVADESYVEARNQLYIAVRDGKPLKRWLPYSVPDR